jgi:CHAT domain-containing protein/tetratricopeptide (TPR) repeat protein
MSACSTGGGDKSGEAPSGLVRAFFHAGGLTSATNELLVRLLRQHPASPLGLDPVTIAQTNDRAQFRRLREGSMRRRVSLFSIVLLLGGLCTLTVLTPAAAQQIDLNAISKRANELYAAGNYPAALVEAQKFEAGTKARFGTDHANYAIALNTLANVYHAQGRFAEAEAHFKRALAIREVKLGGDHVDVSQTLNNLAAVYRAQGRFAEAEVHYQRALAIRERKLGKDHPRVALTVNNLAIVYRAQGKYAEAEALYKRALAIEEKKGKDHPDVAQVLNNLAVVYRAQGRYSEAEVHHQRALAIREAKLGKDHPSVAQTISNLATVYWARGKYAEAEALYKRALAIDENKGKDHPDVATTLNNLASVHRAQEKYVEAEALYMRALAIREAKLGKDHPAVAETLDHLAVVYLAQGKAAEALTSARKASAAIIGHAATEAAGARQRSGAQGLVEQRTDYFRRHVAILHTAARQGIESDMTLAREAFEIAQWAGQSSAAAALAQMAARQAKGTGALAQVVRERQDLERQWHAFDARLNGAVAKGDVALSAVLRSELSGLNAKFAAIDARLAREFPDYAALVNPKPLSVAAVQALLGPEEALFLTIDASSESFAWLVTKTDARWVKLALSPQDIAGRVQVLRCGLDRDGEWKFSDEKRWNARKTTCKALAPDGFGEKEEPPFDLAVSHELYERLFGPLEDMIRDKQLLIVSSGALASLPFQVLVTEKPAVAFPADGSYAGVPWLGARHTTSVLPSVTSLKALREHAKASASGKPYLGLGNPLLTGRSGSDQRALRKQSCPNGSPGLATQVIARTDLAGDAGKLMRGGLADVAELRRQQPLPETVDELCDVGRSLAAPPGDILLGGKATERTVKSLSASGALAGYRVLHFATHGLLPQETASIAAGLTEAALVLTPPEAASDEDDGLLTASEVTLLKLSADWVIMSACNTGGGDKSGEALSGLARAFFYAGARALLVSHWYVDSASAVALTIKTFDEMKRDPTLGRAEALRRSMQALIASGGRFTHPANWAPFVVVGEGAR